ncbi:MAG: 50S ribosomal protein L13 [Candidatus Bathyarchaeota archaeon]|nr:50S ribosomal protein L13 [Candidatus Bathyarchaeota archaeon]MDH5494761.1 50S ribosomal protein L13 [Candidatus Bathyarchaeota archaeon]
MKPQSKLVTIVDADNLILGRMATVVAKRLLQGESVIILNAEKAVISGKRLSRVKETKQKLEIGHPRKGPYFPKRPDRFVKRAIRGMLPRKKPKGIEAYKRLRVFIGVPKEFKDHQLEIISEARAEKLKCPYITVGKLVEEIGWIPVGE